jgi:hypothetical protein
MVVVVEPRTLDASLVVHLWMETHDRVLRARIVDGPDGQVVARGIDAICLLLCDALESVERQLSTGFDYP